MRLYAGVGVVAAADAVAEWRELNLKTTPLESLVAARDGTNDSLTQTKLGSLGSLAMAPNANQAWADVLIGELFRDGVRVFCVAPGSRMRMPWRSPPSGTPPRASSCAWTSARTPLRRSPRQGRRRAAERAVITSSGTAVANLLPAAVERARPLAAPAAHRGQAARAERTGANQTIDQTKLRPCPSRPSRPRRTCPPGARPPAFGPRGERRCGSRGARPGPVHLNCQFRDPLGPVPAPWNPERDLRGLEGWESRVAPLSFAGGAAEGGGVHDGESRAAASDAAGVAALARLARSARRGVLVIAGGASDGAAAALAATELAAGLGWAVVADAASGVRGRGRPGGVLPARPERRPTSLCSASMRAFFKPDVIVQVNPRLTSKRVQTALEAAALDGGAAWAVVTPQERARGPRALRLAARLGGCGDGDGGAVDGARV